MAKPSTVTLKMPKELKSRLEAAAEQQGVSLNQFALYISLRKSHSLRNV